MNNRPTRKPLDPARFLWGLTVAVVIGAALAYVRNSLPESALKLLVTLLTPFLIYAAIRATQRFTQDKKAGGNLG
ncbi:MAG TPA: hypothetical protein VGH71_05605 [Gammaproteobacteria bacterium]